MTGAVNSEIKAIEVKAWLTSRDEPFQYTDIMTYTAKVTVGARLSGVFARNNDQCL